MRKVLFIVSTTDSIGESNIVTGYNILDIIMPYKFFTEEGFEVEFASLNGGTIPLVDINNDDPTIYQFIKDDMFTNKISDTYSLENLHSVYDGVISPIEEQFSIKLLKLIDYDAIFLPNGLGYFWDLTNSIRMMSLIKEFYERGGTIGTIAFGVLGLLNVVLSDNTFILKNVSIPFNKRNSNTVQLLNDLLTFDFLERLEYRGAKIINVEEFTTEKVINSNGIVVGDDYPSTYSVVKQILDHITIRF